MMVGSFSYNVEKKILKAFSDKMIIDYDREGYYSHPTFLVRNLADYIQLVTIITSVSNSNYSEDTVIFRGMSDEKYQLIPGLSRLKNENEDNELEYKLINDFLIKKPDAFSGLSDFDVLAKMQHYGLPTRLLDFTLNPLIALYFACDSNFNKDGRIVCHLASLQNDTNSCVNMICQAAMRKDHSTIHTIDQYLKNGKYVLDYLFEMYLSEKIIAVRPKYWNQRIANQMGVFILFPDMLFDKYYNIFRVSDRLSINKSIKELDVVGFNSDSLEEIFKKEPIDYYRKHQSGIISKEYAEKLVGSYNNNDDFDKIQRNFENRFIMLCDLKQIDRKIIKNNCCSIIIDNKRKKKILKELSYIGFGADYIYPELEYTAKEIKMKYE